MPCSDGSSRSCDGSCNITEVRSLRARNDKLAQMLCALCGELKRAGTDSKMYPHGYIDRVKGLADWWKEHQEFDRKREEKERQAKRAQRLKEEAQLHELAKKLGKRII